MKSSSSPQSNPIFDRAEQSPVVHMVDDHLPCCLIILYQVNLWINGYDNAEQTIDVRITEICAMGVIISVLSWVPLFTLNLIM